MDKTSEELEDNIADVALDAVILLVRASKDPGKAKNVIPIKKELKQGVGPGRASQYPVRLGAHKGLEPLLNTDCLENVSLSSVHGTIPNPYTSLASAPETNACFTVPDSKESCFLLYSR